MGAPISFITGTKGQLFEAVENKTIKNGTFIFTSDDERFYLYLNDTLSSITPPKEKIIKNLKTKSILCASCGAPLSVETDISKYSPLVKCEHCGCVNDIEIEFEKE